MLDIHLDFPLANLWVSDSPTVKIKTAKISETRILACFVKICTRENYQPYGIIGDYRSHAGTYQEIWVISGHCTNCVNC